MGYKLTFILNNFGILFKKAKIFQYSLYHIIRTVFFYICVQKNHMLPVHVEILLVIHVHTRIYQIE